MVDHENIDRPLAARGFSVVVRSWSESAQALGSLRAALREYDSGQVMINDIAMEEGIARALAGRRFSLILRLTASYVPAHRALRVDAVVALRRSICATSSRTS